MNINLVNLARKSVSEPPDFQDAWHTSELRLLSILYTDDVCSGLIALSYYVAGILDASVPRHTNKLHVFYMF